MSKLKFLLNGFKNSSKKIKRDDSFSDIASEIETDAFKVSLQILKTLTKAESLYKPYHDIVYQTINKSLLFNDAKYKKIADLVSIPSVSIMGLKIFLKILFLY